MKKNNVLKLEVVKNLSKKEKVEVSKINFENLAKNGGQLHFAGILAHHYVVLAKLNNVVVGYALLYQEFLYKNDLYVMQVAVDKRFQHCGIGSKMYEYAYKYSKGYSYLTSNVNPKNINSQKFHEKMGFRSYGINQYGLIYIKPVKKEINETFKDAKPICFKLKGKDEEKTL